MSNCSYTTGFIIYTLLTFFEKYVSIFKNMNSIIIGISLMTYLLKNPAIYYCSAGICAPLIFFTKLNRYRLGL